MIHPNRTYLLQQKEKCRTLESSLSVLKARRQALIVEFLNSARPFLATRKQISGKYRKAIEALQLSGVREGWDCIASIASVRGREAGIEIEPKNILGVKYLEATFPQSIRKKADERHYDIGRTTPHLEEAIDLFEIIVEIMLQLTGYESKLKKLSEQIRKLSSQYRVLEQRVLPEIYQRLRKTTQYIGEREREDYYRLKRFKDLQRQKSF